MFDNELGGSAHGVVGGGLTTFGRQVIRRMEALQIIVDLAHASGPTIDDVLRVASRPVVVSHTGIRATCKSPRNLSDDQIQRIAAAGGVVGIGFWDRAVCGTDVSDIVRSIRHAADVGGVEHIALGSDFDGTVRTAFDVQGMALLTAGLLEDGFSEGEIAGIMGGNVIRLLQNSLPQIVAEPRPTFLFRFTRARTR
jgi:microsomal dipeptidase-like Zn-dependent dipeptidase